MLVRAASPTTAAALAGLDSRMAAFYEENHAYYGISAETGKRPFILPLVELLRSVIQEKKTARLLEIGAGRSELPVILYEFFGRDELDITLHDINTANSSHYDSLQVNSIYGPVGNIPETVAFDLVVSYFVYEHISEPTKFLDKIDKLLVVGGGICFVCPKYTLPLYIPPAVRHKNYISQLATNIKLVVGNLSTYVSRKPNFWIEVEPAALHKEWRRDFDAVHMVSQSDLLTYLQPRYRIERLPVRYPRNVKGFVSSLIIMSVVARKLRDR